MEWQQVTCIIVINIQKWINDGVNDQKVKKRWKPTETDEMSRNTNAREKAERREGKEGDGRHLSFRASSFRSLIFTHVPDPWELPRLGTVEECLNEQQHNAPK